MQFPTQALLSFPPLCCVLKKLPVNLAVDNPIGEVLPANMYTTSRLGCVISVMFKGCPSSKQASGAGGGGEDCAASLERLQVQPLGPVPEGVRKSDMKYSISSVFPRKHSKENISNLSSV